MTGSPVRQYARIPQQIFGFRWVCLVLGFFVWVFCFFFLLFLLPQMILQGLSQLV